MPGSLCCFWAFWACSSFCCISLEAEFSLTCMKAYPPLCGYVCSFVWMALLCEVSHSQWPWCSLKWPWAEERLSEWEVHYLGIWYHKDNRKGFLCSLPLPKPGSALVLTETLNPLVNLVTSSHQNEGLHTSAFLTDLQISCSVLNIPKHLRDTRGCGCACKYVSLHKPFCSNVTTSIQALVIFSSYHYGT
jgi:hypothetical protein